MSSGEQDKAIDRVHVPHRRRAPLSAVVRRIGFALGLMVFVALVVRIGRDGYVDVTNDPISFLDALYYASVTVTTTGYGDITAVSDGARFATILLITPARILFLILVVGTTVEVLTEQSRRFLATRRWRQQVNDHFVICGFGATGESAAHDLMRRGIDPGLIVAVDLGSEAVERATHLGFVAVQGDATHSEVLHQAGIERARSVIVVPNRDDTAVLVTLTARELNPNAHIVAGGREQENLHLLRQGGANEVIDATAAVGRMLGIATYAPAVVTVLEDLIDAGTGIELVETSPDNAQSAPRVPAGDTLVAVIRNGERLPPAEMDREDLRADDRLVVLRDSPA